MEQLYFNRCVQTGLLCHLTCHMTCTLDHMTYILDYMTNRMYMYIGV